MVRHYDHLSGKLSRPYKLNSNHFIITSGLHALHLPSLRNCHDLSIFLDIDENLRRFFKLKRDVLERGYEISKVLASLSRRQFDSEKFIMPQGEFADLKISLQPLNFIDFEHLQLNESLKLKLVISSVWGMQQESLFKALVGICGLHVDMEFSSKKNEIVMIIEGDVLADDIELVASKTLTPLNEILDFRAKWEDGIKGLMQLIVLTFVNQSLKERLVC
jgi:phosphoribulokinase